MTDATVTVELSFAIPPYEQLPETDVAARVKSAPDAFADIYEQECQVTVRCGDMELVLGDTMLNLVPQILLTTVSEIMQGGTFSIEMFASDEEVTLVREGGTLKASGEYAPEVVFPLNPTLMALVAAGERFVDLLSVIWPEAEEEVVADLRTYRDEIRAFVPD
ncbi:MAG: hypothetical protein AB8B51_04170 [Sedimentitalea sp.]